MWLASWRRKLNQQRKCRSGSIRRMRLSVERLENRHLLSGGSLDPTFGSGGVVTTSVGPPTWANSVATYPQSGTSHDGKIVVAGGDYTTNAALVGDIIRYNLDGALDSSFAGSGIATNKSQSMADVAVQGDGKVVGVGRTSSGGYDFALSRYNANGTLDTSFGAGGVAQSTGVSATNSPGEIALEPDGRIVVAGSTTNSIAVARFLAAGPQIGSFTASPNPAQAGSSVTLSAWNITDLNPNSTINQVAYYLDTDGDGVLQRGADLLLGYGIQTSPGVWNFTFSTESLASGTYTLFVEATDNYGVLGDILATFKMLT